MNATLSITALDTVMLSLVYAECRKKTIILSIIMLSLVAPSPDLTRKHQYRLKRL